MTETNIKEYRDTRGSGAIGTTYDYLKDVDPISYYYEKLKSTNNPYLKADMWSQAAKRGESNLLANYILKQPKTNNGAEANPNLPQISENKYFDTWEQNQDVASYEEYMLALSIPTLDNTDATRQERTTTLDNGEEYSFGTYTDQQWAIKIFEEQAGRWEMIRKEEAKKNANFWERVGMFAEGTLAETMNVAAGVVDFFSDCWNVLEGVANMFANWSGDENVGARFMYAFQDEDGLEQLGSLLKQGAYELERDTLLVNVVDAYDQGYRSGSEGVGAGRNWWGNMLAGVSTSIGYMLPSMLIPIPAGPVISKGLGLTLGSLAKSAIFYTGIFSGNISDTVNRAKMNGISYKDLNAGEVIGNAALKAAAQYAVELALGKILGSTHLDKLFGRSAKGVINTGVKAPTRLGSFGRVVGGLVKDAAQEGLEELLQDVSDGLIDLAFGQNNSVLADIFKSSSSETLNINNLVQSFTAGALTSMIMGTVADAKFILPKNRAYGIDSDGKAYKLGTFESIDYANSLSKMLGWRDTLNDSKASQEAKLDAAFKLSVAYDTMSKMFTSMESSEVAKANQLLLTEAAVKETKESAIMKMSEPEYGNKLMTDFMSNAEAAQKKYITEKTIAKIKKAAERKAQGLKENLVTKFTNIITGKNKVENDSNINTDVQQKVISLAEMAKLEAIVSHDGNIITRSGDIVFVPDSLLMKGDIKSILEGVAYEDAIEVVKNNLNNSQKKMLVEQYNKIVGAQGTLDEAITALLFDKYFYCSTLLLSGERKYKNDAINMLITVDKIIEEKLSPEISKGTITEDAFNKLMQRVRENMRAGLINFGTTYARLDLDAISKQVLSDELKQGIEEIRTNANVIVSEFIDTHTIDGARLTEKEEPQFENLLNMLNLEANTRKELIEKAHSDNVKERRDAFMTMSAMLTKKTNSSANKLVYLPTMDKSDIVFVNKVKSELSNFIGMDFDALLKGEVDFTKFTEDFQNYMIAQGIDINYIISQGIDIQPIMHRTLDNLLFQKSAKTFCLNADNVICKVIDGSTFTKEEYLGKDGEKKLRTDIKNGKIKTVQDISKVKLSQGIADIKIRAMSTKSREYQMGIFGYWDSRSNSIFINTTNFKGLSVVLHEMTHAAQDFTPNKIKAYDNNGGQPLEFQVLTEKSKQELRKWLEENAPMYYQYMMSKNASFGDIIYYVLEGELQARAVLGNLTNGAGFVFNNERTKLIAPDGREFSLKVDINLQKAATKMNKLNRANSLFNKETQKLTEQQTEKRVKELDTKIASLMVKSMTEIDKAKREAYQNELETLRAEKKDLSTFASNKAEYNKAKKELYAEDYKAEKEFRDKDKTNEGFEALFNDIMRPASMTMKEGESKAKEPARVKITNELAKGNFLAVWVQKGKANRFIDKRVAKFVRSISKEDFTKLPKVLQNQILNAELNLNSIYKYVGTASNMNDYTFKTIAKYVFNNTELAKMTFKDFKYLTDNIADLSAVSFVLSGQEDNVKIKSVEDIKQIKNKISKDPELNRKLVKGYRYATTIKSVDKETGAPTRIDVNPELGLNLLFFNHYEGTFNSLKNIDNMSKYITYVTKNTSEATLEEGRSLDSYKNDSKWQSRVYEANTDYEAEGNEVNLNEALETIDDVEKRNTIEDFIMTQNKEKLSTMSENEIKGKSEAISKKLQEQMDKIDSLSDEQINQLYLKVIAAVSSKNSSIKVEADLDNLKSESESRDSKIKKIYTLGRTIRTRIAGLKTRYNKLSETTKKYIDPNNKYYLKKGYGSIEDAELDNLLKSMREDAKNMKTVIKRQTIEKDMKDKLEKTLNEKAKKLAEKEAALKEKEKQLNKKEKETKSMREKLRKTHLLEVKSVEAKFSSNNEANQTVQNLLKTEFSNTAMSNLKVLDNTESAVVSGKEFFERNADIFMNADISQIEDAIAWFLDARLHNASAEDIKQFEGIRFLFLGYVMSQSGKGGIYEGLNNNLKQRVENALKGEVSSAGSKLSNWKEIIDKINPVQSFVAASMIIDNVEIQTDLKTELFEAIMSNDIERIKKAEKDIYEYVNKNAPKHQSILRRITATRSMMMLSSPITWLRNRVSNFMLKRINKVADAIGKKVFTGKHVEGQLKLNKQVTPEIQNFINKNFIDNKMFDTFVGQLSRYNPSDITDNKKNGTKPTKEEIMAKLVLKAMYSEYYSNETFKSPFMKEMHKKLMKVLSDNNYVRESAVRTFGKILAEKGYDLSDNKVTDEIMNDFSTSLGVAMSEYMHSDNVFNQIEKWIGDRSEVGLFAYKLFMPYASASWNWFKGMIKLSPIGLARSIVKMARLEKSVAKQQQLFNEGKSQISGELAEYMIRRDFGRGVLGTILWGAGMLLASLGFIRLEDDDYGTPKIKIGNIEVDVSQIFGSSSMLAGAAVVTQIQKNGVTWNSFEKGMNAMFDVWLDQMPIMDIVQMDMYSHGTFSMGIDQLESIALSFIPNILSFIAGATYTGKLRKNTFLDRAMAKIPFLGNFVEKQIDPYTGKDTGIVEIFNRVIPYVSFDAASQNEEKSNALGLNKRELTGKYTVNGEEFNISGKDLTAINQAYGEWNAEDLTKFYDNQLAVKVKVGNQYKNLKYSQMNDDERKRAVQTLMQNNAELAKIIAWLSAGNKYYASATEYTKLTKAGYTKNLYRGTKGFVKA